ncbi:MAG: GNAT family N-acetyltransferase [Eubacteriales bacterium]|nr:GNAT family N-acetyltransferase [Eubacteriales bacterium]
MGIDISEIDYLGIDRVLKRGTGEIIVQNEDALLVRDSVSEALLLACEDIPLGISILDRYMKNQSPDSKQDQTRDQIRNLNLNQSPAPKQDQSCSLLMVTNNSLGKAAFERYGFSEKLECFQVAYYGDPPAADPAISVRPAEKQDLPFLIDCYHLISPEELEKVVERQTLLLGYCREQWIGFIGEHLEGSMGLLYIFPGFRRRGYAAALEKHYIAMTMEKGLVPFGQVEKNNRESLLLQKKIGMRQSEKLICWMWK